MKEDEIGEYNEDISFYKLIYNISHIYGVVFAAN
jgi:hypothetical protein